MFLCVCLHAHHSRRRASWFFSSQVWVVCFRTAQWSAMAITAINFGFPTIIGGLARARGQVLGREAKAVERRRRGGCVNVAMHPISCIITCVRCMEKLDALGEGTASRRRCGLDQGGAAVMEVHGMEAADTEVMVQHYVSCVDAFWLKFAWVSSCWFVVSSACVCVCFLMPCAVCPHPFLS